MERLARLGAHLGRDAGAAAGIDLGLRHPDHVLVGHPHRQVTADLAQQEAAGARRFVGEPDRREPVDVKLRIGDVLIADEPARAFLDHIAGGGRHHRNDLALEIRERGGGAALAALRGAPGGAGLRGRLEAGAEAAQVGLHGLAVGADRALECLDRHGQPVAARDGAEHHRVDEGSGAARDLLHVEQEVAPRVQLDGPRQPRGIMAPVAHRDLLADDIEARGRCDRQRAVGRNEARRHHASGFHQLARHQQIDVADAGNEGEHRPPAGKLAPRSGQNLDIVGGRAGALRHARDRRRLHRKIVLLGRGHDPVGEHAAALAAERGDQDGEGPIGRAHDTAPCVPDAVQHRVLHR